MSEGCDPVLEHVDSYVECMDRGNVKQQEPQPYDPPTIHHSLSDLEASILKSSMSPKAESKEEAFGDLYVCCSEEATEEKEQPQCAICYEAQEHFAELPCCHTQSSTLQFCNGCILILTQPSAAEERLGLCPRCQSWIAVSATDERNLSIRVLKDAGKCMICNQLKEKLVQENVCDACFLGRQQPMLYECQQCHGIQRIPHPMYRYQPSIDEFGNVSWACNIQCGKFTYWRVQPDQAHLIPVGDAPWDDDYLEVARQRVREARRTLVVPMDSNACLIL